jgi:hypothetical protein
MTSTIRRKQELSKRSITVTISLESKDSADSALIEKYGDIQINPSGYFNDPNEVSYPKFLVEAGDIVSFYTKGSITAIFIDNNLTLPDLQKRADLWADKIVLDIQNAMTALRALTDTTTLDTTITI